MPTIYRIIRDESVQVGDGQGLPKGAAGAAMINEDSSGEEVSGYLALYKAGRMIVIRHPCEDSDLKANGETFKSAQAKGVLFFVTPNICRACGATVESYKLNCGFPGCLGPLLFGLGVSIVMIFASETSLKDRIFWGFMGALGAFSVWPFVGDFLGRLKFPEMVRQFRNPSCPRCGGSEICPVDKVPRKGLTLKNGKRVRVVFAGMS